MPSRPSIAFRRLSMDDLPRLAGWFGQPHVREYDALAGAGPGVAGLDLFLCEPQYIHRGWGGQVIRRFLDEIVFANGKTRACVAGPAAGNAASIRAFEKAGFRKWKLLTTSQDETEHLLHIGRAEQNAA
jgi:L-amino acid N-acyltransferase YncA